ncbi:CaiB/BaiF CoA-transferase family protein [Bacillus sp. B15-48]|uniref:CaiB/BaiF CoA transferase family protein n=1 Tax=Bacillus sp. B15-48 TaxID=1548601 RepID=UPI00193F9876|nr:CaiB/BaiF CoA-transferase family protein [Bacillus sp. B15-48]MBM4764575.1 CoA transferase [Bacillus sp. B15-48]
MEFGNPLKGVKVVELSTYAAAPAAARILADWGAEVIKIEGPAPDPIRGYSVSMGMPNTREESPIHQFENANKKGIALNLKSPAGMEALHKLIESADVFISNTRLQSLTKLGLDYETLHAKYPKLVWAHVSGLGSEGPEASKPGFDITAFWSRSGALLDVTQPGYAPNNSPSGAGDHTLSLGLAAGILGALFKQRNTGEGERVSVSLLGTATWAYAMMVLSTQYGDEYPKSRTEPNHPLMSSYRCKDGEWFMLTVIEYGRFYETVCKVLGLEHLIDDARYNTLEEVKKRRPEMVKMMDDAFASQDLQYWVDQFTANDVPCERIRHFADVHKDPQGWANGNLTKFKFESGRETVIPCSPIQFSTNVAPPCERAPHFGEHNAEVLSALGYTDAEIEEMFNSGAIFADKTPALV